MTHVFYHKPCAFLTDDFDDKLRLLSEAAVTGWSLEQKRSVFALGQEFAFYISYNSY
jgi:hypothetical protein